MPRATSRERDPNRQKSIGRMGSVGFVCGAQLQRDGPPGPRRFSIVLEAAAVLSPVACSARAVHLNYFSITNKTIMYGFTLKFHTTN
jgi:hypothetical protein